MTHAQSTLITSDWTNRFEYDWRSSDGQLRLRGLAHPRIPYSLADFQPETAGRLLMGQDVLLCSATGDGKTTTIYLYCIARPDTVNIIISPTNALESDMVCLFTLGGTFISLIIGYEL